MSHVRSTIIRPAFSGSIPPIESYYAPIHIMSTGQEDSTSASVASAMAYCQRKSQSSIPDKKCWRCMNEAEVAITGTFPE